MTRKIWRLYWFPILIMVLLVWLAGCGLKGKTELANSGPPATSKTIQQEEPQKNLPLSPITGEPYEHGGSIVAVSVENSIFARPQSGLNKADIVYEALAEGGITRFLAVYYSHSPATVGPVRSARPYLVLLAKEWGAIFSHCGGDPKDIEPIHQLKVIDADEFKYGQLYWRDNLRKAPHNLYTNIDKLRTLVKEPLPAPVKRYDFREWATHPVTGLKIVYGRDYAVEYKYNGKNYSRYMYNNGKAQLHTDRETGKPLEVSNVIVQYAASRIAYPDGGLIIDLIGKGKAVYLLGGRYEEGTWEKAGVESPTVFYTSDKQKIVLTPGQTWVQIVPLHATVTVLQKES